ncbi:MAG: 7TM diverse intracellular signaling domain-containing protein [Bacteroidota bacterium]
MKLRVFFVLLFLSTAFVVKGQVTFSTAYYHDVNPQKKGKYIVSKLNFIPLTKLVHLPALANKGSYLFKLNINQPIPVDGLILTIWNEHLDTIALYRLQADTLALVSYAGNNFYKNQSRLGPPTFKLQGTNTLYFLKASFKKSVLFPVHIYTVAGYAKFNLLLLFQLGLYHGVVIIVFLANLFLFFVFKDRRFLYYNSFLLFLVLSFLYSNSHFPIFTQNAFLLNHADLLLHLGLCMSGALFATSFLEIRKTYWWLKWANTAFIALIMIAYITGIYYPKLYGFLIGEIAVFGNLAMYWVISLYRVKQHPFAKYFAMAYGVLLFFTINFYVLHLLGIFWFDMFTGQLEVANMIEMFILSVALIYSVDELHRQNQHFRLEIDRYLFNEISLQNQSAEKAAQVFDNVQAKYHLTEREAEVLKGITDGLTNLEIGDRLFLSVNTIKFHTRNIFDKMEISNRAQAVSKIHEPG